MFDQGLFPQNLEVPGRTFPRTKSTKGDGGGATKGQTEVSTGHVHQSDVQDEEMERKREVGVVTSPQSGRDHR